MRNKVALVAILVTFFGLSDGLELNSTELERQNGDWDHTFCQIPEIEDVHDVNFNSPAPLSGGFFHPISSVERIERKMVKSNIIISGIPEIEKETPFELFAIVDSILQKLNLTTVEYSLCHRRGNKRTNSRIVQVELVKEKDKYAHFANKAALRLDPTMKSIYINPELTKQERITDGKLREAGRNLKAENSDATIRIRNGILNVTLNGGHSQQYMVDDGGSVVEKVTHLFGPIPHPHEMCIATPNVF